MSELYTSTLKYFRLAIKEFLPRLRKLQDEIKDKTKKEKIENMVEAYEDIASKIDKYNLSLEDPNRYYDGEPHEIDIDIPQPVIEELARLSINLLNEWKSQLSVLKRKQYLTNNNKEKIYKLEHFIWPLEALSKEQGYVLGKYSKLGPLDLPSGEIKSVESKIEITNVIPTTIFPQTLIDKLPKDVEILCLEFNFNFIHHNPHSCMLLLRRMLPLSIVRKFQSLNRDSDLRDENGEYFGTERLLGICEAALKDKRIYKEVMNYKSLFDSSQHSFSLNLDIVDTQGAGIVIRKFLDDIF